MVPFQKPDIPAFSPSRRFYEPEAINPGFKGVYAPQIH